MQRNYQLKRFAFGHLLALTETLTSRALPSHSLLRSLGVYPISHWCMPTPYRATCRLAASCPLHSPIVRPTRMDIRYSTVVLTSPTSVLWSSTRLKFVALLRRGRLGLGFAVRHRRSRGCLIAVHHDGERGDEGSVSSAGRRSKCARLAPSTSLRIVVPISKTLPAAGRCSGRANRKTVCSRRRMPTLHSWCPQSAKTK